MPDAALGAGAKTGLEAYLGALPQSLRDKLGPATRLTLADDRQLAWHALDLAARDLLPGRADDAQFTGIQKRFGTLHSLGEPDARTRLRDHLERAIDVGEQFANRGTCESEGCPEIDRSGACVRDTAKALQAALDVLEAADEATHRTGPLALPPLAFDPDGGVTPAPVGPSDVRYRIALATIADSYQVSGCNERDRDGALVLEDLRRLQAP